MEQHSQFEEFIKKHEHYIAEYHKNPLLQLFDTAALEKAENRARLLSAIQTFSNYFQKVVLLRSVFAEEPAFYAVALAHLKEEFLHNEKLLKDRHYQPPLFDPILEGTTSWFCWRMLTLNDEEKLVLVHCVLEASAVIFFRAADPVMRAFGETDYFSLHNSLDEQHEKLGLPLLEGLSERKYQQLYEVQRQGWAMVNTACARIAELTLEECHAS